jgi:hypothetical protein
MLNQDSILGEKKQRRVYMVPMLEEDGRDKVLRYGGEEYVFSWDRGYENLMIWRKSDGEMVASMAQIKKMIPDGYEPLVISIADRMNRMVTENTGMNKIISGEIK